MTAATPNGHDSACTSLTRSDTHTLNISLQSGSSPSRRRRRNKGGQVRRTLAGAALAVLLAACGGSNSPDTEAVSADAPAALVEIEYVIHGTTTRADVTMRVASGLRQDADLVLPERSNGEHEATYTHTIPAGDRLYLSAQNGRGSGVIRCSIVDSHGRTLSSTEATGGYAIATCEGRAR